jgi:membrane protease YdiL (CAAX protease family)
VSEEQEQIDARETTDKQAARPLFKEALLIYLLAFFLVLGLALASNVVPLIATNLYALVAMVFIGIPYWWMGRKRLDGEAFALTTKNLARDVGIGLIAGFITLIPFAGGQYVWETQVFEREAHFHSENWWRWPAELDGEPGEWGQSSGSWIWETRGRLRIGMRQREGMRHKLVVEGDRPFVPAAVGSGLLVRAVLEDGKAVKSPLPHKKWELQPSLGFRRVLAEIHTYDEEKDAIGPRELSIVASRTDGYKNKPPMYIGPAAQLDPDSKLEIKRSMIWLLLWAMTQLLFIALPEEYFYRGYLQTRLDQAFAAWRGSEKPPGKFGISAGNLSASVLFGLGHLLVPVGGVLLITRFTVFFPSLVFGWLRDRTGGIAAPLVYHACCNMMVLVLAAHYH